MNWIKKCSYHFSLVGILAICTPTVLFSQTHFKGKVIYQDELPVPFASIELSNHEGGGLSDGSGNFSFYVSKLKKDDTLLISSVGYETLKIPALTALKKSKFILVGKINNLEAVTVKAFTTHQTLGSNTDSVGYFRSWSHENTGGEIGRLITVPYKEYKIDKIRFKANNLCETCLLRTRIRAVVDGKPGSEIRSDSITVTIKELTLDDKASEFDLTPYDLTFTQPELFVSIEVINCKGKGSEACYFCFAGTEKGEYIYKTNGTSEWQAIDDYTIYLKLFLRY